MRRLFVGMVAVALVAVCDLRQAEAAIEFFDDFNDGNADGWVFPYNSEQTQAPGGDWRVENDTLVQYFKGDDINGLVDNLFLSNQVIEAQVQPHRSYAGVTLWYQQVNATFANYVAVTVGGRVDEYSYINGKTVGYNYYHPAPGFNDTDWRFYDLKVVADSAAGSLAVYLDGTYIFTHFVSTPYRTGLSGTYSGNEVSYFDNFRVTLDDIAAVPEPASLAVWSFLAFAAIGCGWWKKRNY